LDAAKDRFKRRLENLFSILRHSRCLKRARFEIKMRKDVYEKYHEENVRDLHAEGVQVKVKGCPDYLAPKGVSS
jgi:hypothetical protein